MSHHVRNHEKEGFWRLVLEEQTASGLSIRQFCQQEELQESSFYSWRRTICQRDEQSACSVDPPAFVPAVVTPLSSEPSIVLELAGGDALKFPASIPTNRLVELVRALELRGER